MSLSLAALLSAASGSGAFAASYQVKMLNRDSSGRAWQFEPALLKIAPGDTVTFVPADKGHTSETVAENIPKGATPWKSGFSEPLTVTYMVEGVYIYKCLPHERLGMVGVILVGDNGAKIDLTESTILTGQARARVAELLAQANE